MKALKIIISVTLVALLTLFSLNCAAATISSECDISDIAVPISTVTENVPVGTTLDIKAKSAILLEPYSGQILYEMNADELLPPAAEPYTVTVFENPYSRSQINEGYLTLHVNSGGADSPRQIKLRHKPSTGQWFLWEQFLLSDIRKPVSADPWA